jgi:hypothetical protein
MKLSDFILLNEDEKRVTVLHQGVLIAKRNNFDFMVFLFQMGSYYVEAYCNPQNKAIEEYRVFDNINLLNKQFRSITCLIEIGRNNVCLLQGSEKLAMYEWEMT